MADDPVVNRLASDDPHVMRIMGDAQLKPTPFDGFYLVRYDPAARNEISLEPDVLSASHCLLWISPNPERALRATALELMDLYRAVCPCGGGRIVPDGKPCRPLTAYTITIEPDTPEGAP